MSLKCEWKASSSSIKKHWGQVLIELSSNAFACSSLERVLQNMQSWRIEMEAKKRDCYYYPAQYAEFIIEENELRVYSLSVITGERKKLMAIIKTV